MKKVVQLSIISNPQKKEFWYHPILGEAVGQMMLRLGREDSPYNIISDPQLGCETSQVARNFAAWHCVQGHQLETKDGPKLVKPDFLLMIDADMSPELPAAWAKDGQSRMNDILDLVRTVDENGYSMFGALYPGWKYQRWFLHVYRKNRYSTFYEEYSWQDLIDWRNSEDFVRSVDAIGTGAVCIKRETLEAVWDNSKAKGIKDRITGLPVIFGRGRDNIGRTYHGEDLLFCTTIKELGFEVFTSIGCIWGHYHTIDLMEIPPSMMGDVMETGNPKKPSWVIEDYNLPKDWKPPELTTWSMTPGGCKVLRELMHMIPMDADILEFGPGISSAVLLKESKINMGFARVEHSKPYREHLEKCNPSLVSVLCSLVNGFYDYKVRGEWHLIVVDGPPSHEGTREPAMYKVFDHWAVGGYLVLDDAQREPEKSIVAKWKADFAGLVECKVREDGYGRELAIFKKVKK